MCLLGMVGIRTVVAGAIAPPVQLSIIEISFARIEHWFALGQHGMTVTRMHDYGAFHGPHKDVLCIRDEQTVVATSTHAVIALIEGAFQPHEFRWINLER